MPAIVIGADTGIGLLIAEALTNRAGEVRAFVTDPEAAPALRRLGIKVAIGDISDDSHVEGAAHAAFSAILIDEAARDERERAFTDSYDATLDSWGRALRGAGVSRVIWIGPAPQPPPGVIVPGAECVAVDTTAHGRAELVGETVRLDDVATIE